jgi:hypothetical protein
MLFYEAAFPKPSRFIKPEEIKLESQHFLFLLKFGVFLLTWPSSGNKTMYGIRGWKLSTQQEMRSHCLHTILLISKVII